MKLQLTGVGIFLSSAIMAFGQYSFTGAYSQNFDSLALSATTANSTAQAWTNDSTLDGWYLFNGAGVALPTYVAGNGSTNAGSAYSYGTVSSTDRAFGSVASGGTYFGSPASGAVAAYIAFAATNTSGSDFSSFTLDFDSEQWRNGGNATQQSYVLEYGFGSTFASVSSWTAAGANFNLVSTTATTTAAAMDGNVAGLTADRGGSIGLTWASGDTLWIRFIELNDAGNDHALAVDNFTLTAIAAAPVPEPSTFAALAGAAALAGTALRRRRKQA